MDTLSPASQVSTFKSEYLREMDKPSPVSQVCMSRESHNMQKNLSTKMYLSKRKFHNRACAKFNTVAMVFRNNENCEAGYYEKKKSHEHGLQKK